MTADHQFIPMKQVYNKAMYNATLYLLFMADLPWNENTITATFADENLIFLNLSLS